MSDDKLLREEDCLTNCYIYPICKEYYGDNYTTIGKFNKRTEQKYKFATWRALVIATLQARKILLRNPSDLTQKKKIR